MSVHGALEWYVKIINGRCTTKEQVDLHHIIRMLLVFETFFVEISVSKYQVNGALSSTRSLIQ